MEYTRTRGDKKRQLSLAFWFEGLARHLLRERLFSRTEWFRTKGARVFDIAHLDLALFVEVKGASNTDAVRIFTDQLERQLAAVKFPMDDALILVFGYRNREGRKKGRPRHRLLARSSGRSWKRLSIFLARNTTVLYAIDLRLLDRLRAKNGSRPHIRDKERDRHTLQFTRSSLRKIAHSTRSTLEELGFSAEEIARWLPPNARGLRSRIIGTTFDGHPISFRFVPLIPNGLKNRLLRRLNGSVRQANA